MRTIETRTAYSRRAIYLAAFVVAILASLGFASFIT